MCVGIAVVGAGVFSRASASRVLRVALASGAMIGADLAARHLGSLAAAGIGCAAFLVLGAILRIVSRDELATARTLAGNVLRKLPRPLRVLLSAGFLR